MITRPLDLSSRLSPPPRDLDVMFWVNVGVIVLFFSLLGSRFVLASGLLIGGDRSGAVELPRSASVTQAAVELVVGYRRDNMILFEGGIYDLRELRPLLRDYAQKHPGGTMLVQAERQVTLQDLARLADVAIDVGFRNVLLATERPTAQGGGLVEIKN